MIKKSKKVIGIAGFILNLFNLLTFFSMRPCWSGISKTFGYSNGGEKWILDFPVYLIILFFVIFISNLLFLLFSKQWKRWPVVYLVFGVLFFAAMIVIVVLGAKDYMRFVLANLVKAAAAAAAVGLIAWFLYAYPKGKLPHSRLFKCLALFAAVTAACLCLTGIPIGGIDQEPVVYAVEDEYQIVFTSRTDSLGWVMINGKEYYDLYSGSQRDGRIHKISVPMEVLDSAKKYEVYSQSVVYRGPFGGILGRTATKTYKFKPADFSDGLTYMSFSDIHMNKKAALATESKAGDYDFLVLVGDMISDVETFADANYANELAFAMTGGEIPVIYARGNHEVKGAYSDDLYRFVGSKNENFYYSVKMGELYAVVLDIGEDHEDDWWEYYGTADFDEYREDQLKFLDKEISKGDFRKAKYRLAVCHIPPVYVNYRHNHEYIKEQMTERLNRMSIDMCLCGHQHELLIFEPGLVTPGESLVYNPLYKSGTYSGYLTDFKFPSLMVSKFGYVQPESEETRKSQVGLFVKANLDSRTQECWYLNSNGEKISVVNPFADKDYGDVIEITSNKKMK
ncbi:MAG: metallophosphoesterase [Firmicutes bacterium]|nr:metallophosphoesterase [Bacillota bacterium]